MHSDSSKYFERALNNKITEAQSAVENCVKQFLGVAPSSRAEAARLAAEKVGEVVQMLAPTDRPAWLTSLHQALAGAQAQHGSIHGTNAVYGIATEHLPAFLRHDWALGGKEPGTEIDFDQIYRRCVAESRLSELFDGTMALLTQIIESKEIDSIRAVDDINRVISMIRGTERRTFLSTHGAFWFLGTWLKNSGWELIGDVPGMGAIARGLRTTFDDLDAEMNRVDNAARAEFTSHTMPGRGHLEQPEIKLLNAPEDCDRGGE